MSDKTLIPQDSEVPSSQIGATLEALAGVIEDRRGAGTESYTATLLNGNIDELLKKIMEEAGEVALAAKDVEAASIASASSKTDDADVDHLRYEAADLLYHLLVLLGRCDIPLEEFAAELNMRMTDEERPRGAVRLLDEHIKRGK